MTDLKNEKTTLESIKKELMVLFDQIDNYNNICMRKASFIQDLDVELVKVQDQILKLKNSDEYFSKFERIAREKLGSITKDCSWMLGTAVACVVESLRKEPKKQMIITNEEITQESYEAHVLDMSKDLFEKISSGLMDVTLAAEPHNNDAS